MSYCKGGCGHMLTERGGYTYCGGGERCQCGGNASKPCPLPGEGDYWRDGQHPDRRCKTCKAPLGDHSKGDLARCRKGSEPHTVSGPDKRSWYDLYRELAGANKKLEERTKVSEEWRRLSRQNAVEATTAENLALDRLKTITLLLDFLKNEAPHQSNCRYMWGEDCNCWKSRSPIKIVED